MEMTSKTVEALQYFKGKVCTVLTSPINRNFDEQRSREHFVVQVQEITRDAIWGTHPYNGTASFFLMSQVVSIQEEVVLDPVNNPEHKQMIEEYEKKSGRKIVSDVSPHLATKSEPIPQPVSEPKRKTLPEEAAFVPIQRLKQLAQQTKEAYNNLPKKP